MTLFDFGTSGFTMQTLQDGWLIGGVALPREDVDSSQATKEVASRPQEPQAN